MTDIDIDAIRQRAGRYKQTAIGSGKTIQAIQLAENVPALLAKVDELTAEVERYGEILREAAKVLHIGPDEDGDNYGEIPSEAAALNRARWAAEAEVASVTRQLTEVSNELADARNQAHRRDTDHQQTVRANTAWANERDALKAALGQIAGMCNCRDASDCPSVIAQQALATEKTGAAR